MAVPASRSWPDLHWRPDGVRRALIAGAAWGLPMAALIVGREAADCGMICLTDAALTAAVSIATGILALGPLAAFEVRPMRPAR